MSDEPRIGIGHFTLRVTDVARATDFYVSLGMKIDHEPTKGMAILELRGGAHMLIFRAKKKPRPSRLPFDFLVPSVDALQKDLAARGFAPGPMLKDEYSSHRYFTCPDPDGHVLTFTSDTHGH
jgi:catechol 2,3-dioxygenase-like lactoylglutathione lyase family enzyme